MRVVVDTNVLVSSVFFSGIPRRILEAWRDGRIDIVASLEILEEYRRVGERLAAQFEGVSARALLLPSRHKCAACSTEEIAAGGRQRSCR